MTNNASGFQPFEFCFGDLKFFQIKAAGLCKNGGVAAGVDVMLNPISGCGLHIPGSQNGGVFLKQDLTSAGTEFGIGCICFGSKAGKTGWGGGP
jgi:hypothetical protein